MDSLGYRTVVELGISRAALARKFDITPAAVIYTVQKGEKYESQQSKWLRSWINTRHTDE